MEYVCTHGHLKIKYARLSVILVIISINKVSIIRQGLLTCRLRDNTWIAFSSRVPKSTCGFWLVFWILTGQDYTPPHKAQTTLEAIFQHSSYLRKCQQTVLNWTRWTANYGQKRTNGLKVNFPLNEILVVVSNWPVWLSNAATNSKKTHIHTGLDIYKPLVKIITLLSTLITPTQSNTFEKFFHGSKFKLSNRSSWRARPQLRQSFGSCKLQISLQIFPKKHHSNSTVNLATAAIVILKSSVKDGKKWEPICAGHWHMKWNIS